MKTFLPYCFFLVLIASFQNALAKNIAVLGVGSDATLKSIVLSTATTLVYTTGPSDFNYTTSVSPGTATLTVEPTTNDPAATVTVNGTVVPYGSQSNPITLNGIVTTTINLVSVSQDHSDTLTYSIVVYESGSNNAFLSALTISTGNTLVKSSGSSDYDYTTSVAPTVTSLTVTPTTADPNAVSVTVDGTAVPSGTASGPIALNATGTTLITLLVTAQDGVTTQSYSITVSKNGSNIATLSSLSLSTNTNLIQYTGSSSNVIYYAAAVNPSVTSLTVTPTTTDPNATVKVNGTTVTSGQASGSITLNPIGSTTDINVVVTAQDGSTTESYTITVSRTGTSTATLSALSLSSNSLLIESPAGTTGFSSSYFNYTTSVDPALTSITATPTTSDPNASVTVNGVAATSGSPSSAITLNTTGTTTITTVVKSQDGSKTDTYSIIVSRNGSNDDNILRLIASTNTTLVRSGSTFTTSVPSGTTSLTLTPTPTDSTRATVTINGTAVASNTASGPISISPGTNTIPMVVTAQNGASNSFTITVKTNGSNNGLLKSLFISNGILIGVSGSYFVNDTTSVDPATTSLTVTPTTSDASAGMTITVNGVAGTNPTSGSPYTINLAATGYTVVNITVNSPDGTVHNVYSISISKAGSNNPNLVIPLTFSTGTSSVAATGPYNANYTTAVSPHTTSMTVTPIPIEPHATMTVNGLAVAAGTASTPIPLNLSGTTLIVIVVTAEDKKTTKSYGITVSKTGVIFTWTGAGADQQWSTAANWTTSSSTTETYPQGGDIASIGETNFIKSGNNNIPQITFPITVGEIDLGQYNAPKLYVTGGNTLTIATALTVDANSTPTIYATGATCEVDIAAAAALNIASTGTLTITSPIIFKLKSNASGSASLGQITSSSIIGTGASSIQVERYIQGGSPVYRGYRLLSSPVHAIVAANGNNVYSLNYVQGSALVTGTGGVANGFDAAGNPTIYLFREDQANINTNFTTGNYWGISNLNNAPNNLSTTTAPSYLFNGQSSPSYNIPAANGFMFFFRGDRTTNLPNKYSPGTSAESVTMITSGTLNAGPITVHDWYEPTVSTLSYTTSVANGSNRGLHLIGNPYASSIDWDTYNSATSGTGIYVTGIGGNPNNPSVGNTIYILDPVSKNYGVYIANSPFGGTNNATHVIPQGQGFFVQSYDPSATLTFNESAKTTLQVTGPNLLLGTPKQNVVSQYLHLKLLQDTFQADEIFITFKDNAQSKFVTGEDAAQLPGNGIASLASMSSDGVPLSINTLNLQAQSVSIPLNVNSVSDGAYQLTMPEIKSIPAIYDIWLMDAYKKDSVDFRNNPAYSFNILKGDAASYGANRFTMVIRQNPALGVKLLNFTAAKASNGAQVLWTTVNEQNYTNFTVERSTDGGVTFNVLGGFVSSALGSYSFLDKDPLNTANRYRLQLKDLNGNITYSNIVTLIYGNSNNVAGNISVYPNPASSTINLTITPFSSSLQANSSLQITGGTSAGSVTYGIKIIGITGAVVKTATSSSPAWQDNVSSLSPGTYIIQVVNNSNNSLVGKSTFVKL